MFFRPIRKTRWPHWPLIGWDIFDFSSKTAERNSTKLDRKQDLNVLYQVWVFRADRKNKMAALASDWLRHFRLLLWNRWMEFNVMSMEARSQHPLLSLCFSGWSKKQNGCPGLSLPEIIRLFLQNHLMEFNESWQKPRSQHPLPSLRYFWPVSKQKWPPWLILQKGSTLYSGARLCGPLGRLFTSPLKLLNGIQRNLTGSKISTSSTKLCFSVWWVNKNYCPGGSVKKVAHCTRVHDILPFGTLVYVFI